MHVENIRIENARQFRNASFSFQTGFNLLIGENGAGKTTILRSLLVVLGSLRQTGKRTGLYERDIHLGERSLRIEASVRGTRFEERHLRYQKTFGKRASRRGDGSDLTVLYYGANEAITGNLKSRRVRRVTDDDGRPSEPTGEEFAYQAGQRPIGDPRPEDRFGNSEEIRVFVKEVLKRVSPDFTDFYWRFEPYQCAIVRPHDKSKRQVPWEKKLAASVLRYLQENPDKLRGIDQRKITLHPQGYVVGDSDSRSVTPPLYELLETSEVPGEKGKLSESNAEIRLTPRIVIRTANGDLLLSQLSDGQQRVFSLLVDIARVLSLFGQDRIKDTPGIVLIDEIDVHLHPRWQRIVVPALEDLFPACQFIATTHSPFVIQAVDNRRLISPSSERQGGFDDRVTSIEDIIEEIQGIDMPQRGKRAEELSNAAEQYFSLLRQSSAPRPELEEADKAYRIATEPFTSNPALNALLRVEQLQSEER